MMYSSLHPLSSLVGVDCGDFNLGAKGTRSPGGDAGSEQWDDVDDSQLSTYMLAVVCVVAAVVWKSGALWRCITDTLRQWVRGSWLVVLLDPVC